MMRVQDPVWDSVVFSKDCWGSASAVFPWENRKFPPHLQTEPGSGKALWALQEMGKAVTVATQFCLISSEINESW